MTGRGSAITGSNQELSPQSLKSRGYVKEQFAWRHFYWYLTNEGIQYLRDYLHLPPEIVPATLRRSRPETGRPRPKGQLGWAQGAGQPGQGLIYV